MLPRALFLVASAALVAAAAPAQDWSGPASFEVRVEDERGKAVAGAEVALAWLAAAGSDGPAPSLTDGKGRLAIGGLAPGRWELEVRHPGHMTYRATLVIGTDVKPTIESAAQQNVPGARAPMRVRLGKASGAVAAARPVARPAPPAEAAPIVATAAPRPAPTPTPAPARPVSPPVAATSAPTPAAPLPMPPAPSPAPVAPVPAAATPARPVSPPVAATSAPTPAAPRPVPPAPKPAPAAPVAATAAPAPPVSRPVSPPAAATSAPTPPTLPVAPPVAQTPRPAPPKPVPAPRPPAPRTCFECRPGEQALWAEATLEGGGAGCPGDLRSRLETAPIGELEGLRSGLPVGCALLRVDLPRGMRFVGFRYEATGEKGAADCFPNRPCPAGDCRFAGDPVLRREGDRTTVLGLFESTAAAARGAALTVYYTPAKR